MSRDASAAIKQNPDRATIPLPEYLSECGCKWAKMGKHLTTCAPAREFDAIPLTERDGYALGVRFQAITWEFPLRLETTIRVSVELDPVAYIERHRQEYENFTLPAGFQDWEKPMVFLTGKIEQSCEHLWAPFDHARHESRADAYFDESTEYPRWKPEDTDALHAALRPAVDPNQGNLFDNGHAETPPDSDQNGSTPTGADDDR